MFEWFSKDENDAIDILKTDHDNVKELFDKFEKAGGRPSKRKISTQAIGELKVHAAIEEEIFYPAVHRRMGADPIMNEADEEHHVVKMLIAELEAMDGGEDHFDAKFTVLSENVRHHIKEEEGEMLPKARSLDIDLVALGKKMLQRKQELKAVEGRSKPVRKRTAKPAKKRKAA